MGIACDSKISVLYAERVCDLLGDWCRLTSMPSTTFSLLADVVGWAQPFSPVAHPTGTHLCSDRSPIEICERLACRPLGPAITCEPVFDDLPPIERLTKSLHCAVRAVSSIPRAQEIVTATAAAVYADQSGSRSAGAVWIGVDCDAAGEARIKVYFSFDGRAIADIGARCERALSMIRNDEPRRLRDMLNLLQHHGYLRMLSLSFGNDGCIGAKVYARCRRVDLATIQTFANLGGLSMEPFDRYVRRVLDCSRQWFDGRAGIGASIDKRGSVVGMSLYHYTAGYFASDEDLRERLLATAREFGWTAALYRATSRLVDAGAGSRARALLGFGVSAADGPGLHAYARTGYLAA